MNNGEGCLHLQPNTESGERRELPSMVRGRAPTVNEFGYSTAVSIILHDGNYVDYSEVHVYTRKLNRKVSYRKQIARQHSCRKIICQGQVVWSTVYVFV